MLDMQIPNVRLEGGVVDGGILEDDTKDEEYMQPLSMSPIARCTMTPRMMRVALQ